MSSALTATAGEVVSAPTDSVRALVRTTRAVLPHTPVLAVAEQLLTDEHARLLTLPVVSADGTPLGGMSRYEMMRIFLMPYGRELYGKRPIGALAQRSILKLSIDCSIEDAARRIAESVQSPITDDFIVVDANGRYVGTGVVLDVLRAVERRIAQHTGELERAYAKLKTSQLALVQSEKMASLGQMVAGLVHEINTPLGYVRNNVEMTRAALDDVAQLVAAYESAASHESDDDAALQASVERIESLRQRVDTSTLSDLSALLDDTVHGVAQIGELVTNLKDFSRLDQASLQKANVNRIVESALKIAQHVTRKRAIKTTHRAGELPDIDCAPAQLNQVLLNLVTNAAQAIEHERGRIDIRTQVLDKRILILVEDNGKGMAPDHLARVFDPFFTTKPVGQGTGLGLAIAYQIVEQHGGLMRVTSKVGVGTRFLVALPIERRRSIA